MADTKLDNRNRDKTKDLEDIENDETPIDEKKASKELRAEQHQAPADDNTEYTDEDEENEEGEGDTDDTDTTDDKKGEEEEVDEEELDAAEKEAKEKAEKEKEAKKATPELEERYKESTREAQILTERNRQLTDAFIKIDDVKEPTEEELIGAAKADGLEWDELTASERILVKKTFVADQKLKLVQNAVKDIKNIDEWADKVDTFLDENERTQKVKLLIGKEGPFRAFAMKSTHRGIGLDILLSHFLVTTQPEARKKGNMFLSNAGGVAPEKPKTVIDDADSSAALRTSNQRDWARKLKAGKIKIEV